MNIKIVTFNMRIENAESFKVRLSLIADKIRAEKPDVICMQELSSGMQKAFIEYVDGYFVVGGGRETDRLGESVAIAFNKNKFVLSNCRTRWLSPTPDLPGSRFTEDQSSCPRVYTMITLTDVESKATIRIYNTHLDHIGPAARLDGIRQIIRDMKSDAVTLPYPAMLTGDLNADPDKPEILYISEEGGMTDVSSEYTRTFNGFGHALNPLDGCKIDYIFISDGIKCSETTLWDEMPNGVYMSDHYALMAELEL